MDAQEIQALVANIMNEVRAESAKAAPAIEQWKSRVAALEQRIATLGGTLQRQSVKDLLLSMDALSNRPKELGVGAGFGFTLPSKVIAGITAQVPQWTGDVAGLPGASLSVRSLIPSTTTTQGAIQFIRKTLATHNAKPVAEGAPKPESTYTYTPVSQPVETIAHWTKLSKQTYDDLPQLVAELDTELLYGLALAEENQLLKGNGVSPNLTGLYPAATPLAATPPAGATLLDSIGLAIAQLSGAGYVATGVVVNGVDWINALLLKTTTGEYLMGGPATFAANRAWNLSVVISPILAPGEWMVGAFPQGAKLYERETANVQVATQNQDDFINNLVTALGEMREALVIRQAGAFVKNAASRKL
jgi:HK97 family phage major capsid protein